MTPKEALSMQPEFSATRDVPHVGRFTAEARRVLELALREALSLGHNYIGSEHMLLALVRLGEGPAWQTIRNIAGNTERVRAEVLYQLRQPREPLPPNEERIREIVRDELQKHVAGQPTPSEDSRIS